MILNTCTQVILLYSWILRFMTHISNTQKCYESKLANRQTHGVLHLGLICICGFVLWPLCFVGACFMALVFCWCWLRISWLGRRIGEVHDGMAKTICVNQHSLNRSSCALFELFSFKFIFCNIFFYQWSFICFLGQLPESKLSGK